MPEPAPNANRMARNGGRARALMQIARALNICRRVCEPLPAPPLPTFLLRQTPPQTSPYAVKAPPEPATCGPQPTKATRFIHTKYYEILYTL